MPNNKKSTSIKKSNWKRWALWITPIIILLAGYVAWSSWVSPMIEQSKMTTYLKEKYGEEFVVEAPVRKAYGLGVEGYLQANAYPKKSPDLNFSVQSSSSGITDRYPSAVWQNDQEDIVQQLVKGSLPMQGMNANVSIVPDGNVVFQGSVPDYQEARKKLASNMAYSIRLDIPADKAVDFEIKKQRIQGNLKAITDFLIAQDIKTPSITITINVKSDNSRYVCSMYGQKNIEIYSNNINDCFRHVE